jgi:hypothetical protein
MKAPRTAPTATAVAPNERRSRRVQTTSKTRAVAPVRRKDEKRRDRPSGLTSVAFESPAKWVDYSHSE